MARASLEYAHIEEGLVDLIRRLSSELPPNTASIEIKRHEQEGDGVSVVLKPQYPSSAVLSVHAVNGLEAVDFSFGDYGPTWELPIEGHYRQASKQEVLQEIREMCQAVIAGNCKHKRGFLSITGTIQVGERRYKIKDLLVFRSVPSLHGTKSYEPYVRGL